MNNKTKSFKKFTPYLLALFTILAVVAGFFIPGYLLKKETDEQLSVVTYAPEEYYLASNTAMARNTSEKLSSMDKINLITGIWDSTCQECSSSDAFLTEIEAVNLAISQMDLFFTKRIYPASLNSNYNNWYSWSTKVYKYTDTSFNTYTAYLWVITFSKYDSSIEHVIQMTEDGVILDAHTNMPTDDLKINSVNNIYIPYYISSVMQDDNIHHDDTFNANYTNVNINYPETNFNDLTFSNIYQVNINEAYGEQHILYVYQYKAGDYYGMGLVPVK
ncbi:MAG: hypothetical protein IJX12_04550 [Lachnospiraceae bacterium]|nr:hypothetical protein [Lachnospiraceae bacterium]